MNQDTQATGVEEPTKVDTSETQPSEASVQVEKEAPEATQGNEEQESSQTETNQAEDTAEEKLYAGKYKTVEDMEKAYKELQSKATKDAMQKADMEKAISGTLDSQVEEAYAAAEESGDYTPNPYAEKIDRLERKSVVQEFVMSHPEMDVDAVDKVLKEDPNISSINSYQARLEYAYLKSQNMGTSKAIEEAKKTAASETQAKVVEKQTAQIESSRKAESDSENELLSKATSGNADERKAAREALIRKHLINI